MCAAPPNDGVSVCNAGTCGFKCDAGYVPGASVAVAPTGASCVGLAARCGGNKDCCASNVVAGGRFNRSNDASYPATVSDFKLDVYEVTVGRFRAFVNTGNGTQASPPAAGDGAHQNPQIAGSGWGTRASTGASRRAAPR